MSEVRQSNQSNQPNQSSLDGADVNAATPAVVFGPAQTAALGAAQAVVFEPAKVAKVTKVAKAAVFGPIQAAVDKLQQLAYCFAAVTPLLPRLEEHGAPNPIASPVPAPIVMDQSRPSDSTVPMSSAMPEHAAATPTPVAQMPVVDPGVDIDIDPFAGPFADSSADTIQGRTVESLQVAESATSVAPETSPTRSHNRAYRRTSDSVARQLAAAAPTIARRRTGFNRRFGITPVSEVLPNYRPLRYVLDYDAFATSSIDSSLTTKLIALGDAVMSAACDSLLPAPGMSVRSAAPATIVAEAADAGMLVGNGNGAALGTGAVGEQALASIPIDPDVFMNGCLAVDFSLGYPTIGNAIFWERWDNEPADAYRWFKCYLTMPENCGLRNFAQFLNILTSGSLIPVDGRHYFGSHSAQARDDAISSALLRQAVEDKNAAKPNIGGTLQVSSSVVDAQEIARIKAYYHLFYWEDRCMCFNIWETTMLQDRQARRSQFILDDHFTLFQEVFDRVATRVKDSVEMMDPKDAIKALQDIAKMMRLSVGMPADKPVGYNDGPQIINNNNASANNSFPPQLRINFVDPGKNNGSGAGNDTVPELTRVGIAEKLPIVGDEGGANGAAGV